MFLDEPDFCFQFLENFVTLHNADGASCAAFDKGQNTLGIGVGQAGYNGGGDTSASAMVMKT
jgi:hypothetical protein